MGAFKITKVLIVYVLKNDLVRFHVHRIHKTIFEHEKSLVISLGLLLI